MWNSISAGLFVVLHRFLNALWTTRSECEQREREDKFERRLDVGCGRFVILMLLLVASLPFVSDATAADALEKLNADRLEAVRQAVNSLREQRVVIPRNGPFQEHRANLHVHSHWSHDSQGTIDEIVAAARAIGTSVLMFTEHPADHYDFFLQGHQGTKDGVLLIPGAEMKGFLAWPTMSLRGVTPASPQELADLIRGRDGQLFVSHLEERMDWQIEGVTGMEIYNTHADFKEEKRLVSALKNPFRMLQLTDLFRRYPQESFAALQKYPTDYLSRWDELCRIAPHTGVSANDAHQNIGVSVRWIEGDKCRLEGPTGESLIELDLAAVPDGQKLKQGRQPGEILLSLFLDRYETSLQHVATHLLLTELSESAVRECLDAGRAFVAFDWIADSIGFDFVAVSDTERHPMGSQTTLSPGMTIEAHAPLPVKWKLIRNGEVVSESHGRAISVEIHQPGVYRTEAWLDVAEVPTIWILSNPIYVSPR